MAKAAACGKTPVSPHFLKTRFHLVYFARLYRLLQFVLAATKLVAAVRAYAVFVIIA